MDLYEELISVLGVLEDSRLDYALCGGLALGIHGYPRLTIDIDLLVKRKDVPKIKSAIAKVGFTLEAAPMTFGAGTERETRVHRVSKVSGDKLLMLDLIEVEPHFGNVWKDRRRMSLEGLKTRAVSREGLIEMKRRAGRAQDIADLEKLEGGLDAEA